MNVEKTYYYFIPTLIVIFSLLLIILIRFFSLLSYDGLESAVINYLFVFYAALIVGTMLGPLCFFSIIDRRVYSYSSQHARSKFIFLFVLSVLSIILLLFKFIILSGGDFSLSGITQLRLSRGRDSDHESGGLLIGVLGMALSGFPLLTFFYKEYYKSALTRLMTISANILLIAGILVSLLSGGRFAAAISIATVVLIFISKPILFRNTRVATKKISKITKLFIVLFLLTIFYIFSVMFIDRAVGSNDSFLILLDVLDNNFEGTSLDAKDSLFLTSNEGYLQGFYLISIYQYYLAHPFYQFGVLFMSNYPVDAPYHGAYQLYLHTTLLNKFGFDFIPVSEILAQIINPGNYLTLAGAYYLDFGRWGGVIAAFFTSFLGSFFWVKAIKKKQALDIFISLLYLLILIFSPIVSVISAGVYPSLITLALIFPAFLPKKVLSTN